MKKIIWTILISLMILSSVNAQILPMPIAGRVITSSGQDTAGLHIEATNQRTDDIMTFITTGAGEWLIEWANAPSSYKISDEIDIVIRECKDFDVCQETVILSEELLLPENLIIMDITEASIICPDCPSCPTTTTTPITTTISCPTTIPCATTVPCEDCEICEECPDLTWEWIIGVLVTFFVGMGAYKYGFGMKVYTKKSGEIATLHKHPGIIAYHDPDISHKNPKIRHPKGKWNPKYKRDSNNKWYYVGE